MSDLVILERQSEEVVSLILNRPEKRNALSIDLMEQLCRHVDEVEKDQKVRVLLLRGNGPVFCAGLDLNEAMDAKKCEPSAKMVKKCLQTIYQTPFVTIAMVHGAAMAGGAGLVAACDFAVAEAETKIGFPEVRRGLVAAQVMSLLVRKLKGADVKELLLSGESIGAERAKQMGLLNRVGEMKTEVEGIIAQVIQGAPHAIAKTKELIDHLYPTTFHDDIEMCLVHHIQAREEKEAHEGIAAFLEKRKPKWDKK